MSKKAKLTLIVTLIVIVVGGGFLLWQWHWNEVDEVATEIIDDMIDIGLLEVSAAGCYRCINVQLGQSCCRRVGDRCRGEDGCSICGGTCLKAGAGAKAAQKAGKAAKCQWWQFWCKR